MSKKINLGRKPFEGLPVNIGTAPDEPMYPHLHIDDHDDTSLLDMPDEGEARIKYKVKDRQQRESTDENGKKKRKCSMTLAVHHIEPPDKPAPKKRNHNDEARKSASDYFDNLK